MIEKPKAVLRGNKFLIKKPKLIKDTKYRNRSLNRLWAREYRFYKMMLEMGFTEDSKTGDWKYIGKMGINYDNTETNRAKP